MSLPLGITVDHSGRLRARWAGDAPAPDAVRTLIEFLQTDLGWDVAYADRILEHGRRLRASGRRVWKVSGNAYALSIGPRNTHLVLLTADDPDEDDGIEIDTDDFLDVVGQWRERIEGGRGESSA